LREITKSSLEYKVFYNCPYILLRRHIQKGRTIEDGHLWYSLNWGNSRHMSYELQYNRRVSDSSDDSVRVLSHKSLFPCFGNYAL
jgi:hypothetical protein